MEPNYYESNYCLVEHVEEEKSFVIILFGALSFILLHLISLKHLQLSNLGGFDWNLDHVSDISVLWPQVTWWAGRHRRLVALWRRGRDAAGEKKFILPKTPVLESSRVS